MSRTSSRHGGNSLISRYRVLISEHGQSSFTADIALSAASGIVTGLSLLVLLSGIDHALRRNKLIRTRILGLDDRTRHTWHRERSHRIFGGHRLV
jgi:hypothetical protein